MNTNELRAALYNYLSKQGIYVCHEVEIPHSVSKLIESRLHYGRVDILTYQKSYKWKVPLYRCYELKITVTDFRSKHGHNFVGDFNYYVFPNIELFEKVKAEIPKEIGVLIPTGQKQYGYYKGDWMFTVVKKPKRCTPKCDYDKLTHNLICALSRECCIKNVGRYKAR